MQGEYNTNEKMKINRISEKFDRSHRNRYSKNVCLPRIFRSNSSVKYKEPKTKHQKAKKTHVEIESV